MLDVNYLKRITDRITLGPTLGNRTIAGAVETFHYIDRSFQHWSGLGLPSSPTGDSLASIYEVEQDGNFRDFFGNTCCDFGWTENQVIEFCKNNYSWLNHGFATLFPVKGNYFVRVDFDSHSRLGVFAFRSENPRLWRADVSPRFVLPEELKVIEP